MTKYSTDDIDRRARAAYDAWAIFHNYKDSGGRELHGWDSLTALDREAWHQVVIAVLDAGAA